nr:Chain A, ALA-LEU-VAL-PHE-PHE-ALA-PRO-ALA-VAL-GLY-SER [Homo sapiens]
KLVFFAPDVGS